MMHEILQIGEAIDATMWRSLPQSLTTNILCRFKEMKFSILSLLIILTLTLQSVSASLLTQKVNATIENCSICLEPVKRDELLKTFTCKHVGFHTKCIQSWLDKPGVRPTCPICRAPTTPAILSERQCHIKILKYINEVSSEYSDIGAVCLFANSFKKTIKFIRMAVGKSRWNIVSPLIASQMSKLNFQDLKLIYPRVNEIGDTSIYYKTMQLFIRLFRKDGTIFDQNKVCITKKDARCISSFLKSYIEDEINVPEKSKLEELLEIYFTKNPLSINETSVLVSQPRSLITMNTIGIVLNAQCHQRTRVKTYYASAFQLVVQKDLRIPGVFMKKILHYTVLHWSKDELEMVLQYKYLTAKDIQDELAFLVKSSTKKLFLSTHDVPLITQKLKSYKPL